MEVATAMRDYDIESAEVGEHIMDRCREIEEIKLKLMCMKMGNR